MVQEPGFFVIGVDGGGSKTLAILADSRGRELGRGVAEGCNYQVVGMEAAKAAIRTALLGAFTAAGIPNQPVKALCLGLAGIGRPDDRAWVEEYVREEHLAERLTIANDGQLLLWAGTPEGWGIGVVSGTGSIAYGRSPDGREARSGGWGYIMGDEGSGYAIGRAALQAVAQAADGRAASTALTDRILAHWELNYPGDLVAKIYRGGIGRVEIAELAALVFDEAQAGDSTAVRIEVQASRELASMLAVTAGRLHLTGKIPCALGGGVLSNCPRFGERVVRETLKLGIKLDPVNLVEEPVRGAVRLALNA
jgi:N-acetylglucosamine kinase-like BadF-type ATPase